MCKRYFTKNDTWMAHKHGKIFKLSPIREIKINTIHFPEWLKLKRLTISSVGKDVEWLALLCTAEREMLRPLWKAVRQFLKTLNINLPYELAILQLNICPRNKNTHAKIYILHSESLFVILKTKQNRTWKQPIIKERRDNLWCLYTVEYVSVMKRSNLLTPATWINLNIIMLDKGKQDKNSICCRIPFIHNL